MKYFEYDPISIITSYVDNLEKIIKCNELRNVAIILGIPYFMESQNTFVY